MRQIEKFPGFINDIDRHGILTTTAQEWDNCEYVPAVVPRDYRRASYFPFPVKFIEIPGERFLSRSYAAVRTDIYPLLWVYVWLQLQIDELIYIGWYKFMWLCNRLKIAETPLGSTPSFRDFGFKGYKLLHFISWIGAIATAITWFFSDYPYVGFVWVLTWGWVQFRIWQDRRNREKLIAELQPYLRSVQQNWTEDTVFTRDFAGNLIPAFSSKKVLVKSDCQNCKYFYGKHDIVCAVHASGYEGNSCIDAEPS